MSNPEDTASRVAPMKREVGQLRDHYLNPRPSEGLREKVAAFLRERDEALGEYDEDDTERLQSAESILALLSPQAEGGGKP
jgi:hypothetical protein